jgi:hypothetical protein
LLTEKAFLATRSSDSHNLAGTLDGFSFLDETVGTEEHDTDLTSFQVHAHSLDARSEFDQFLGLDVAHAVDTGDTVTDGQNTASLGKTGLLLHATDSLLQDRGDFGGGGFGIGGVRSDMFGGRVERCGCDSAGLVKGF